MDILHSHQIAHQRHLAVASNVRSLGRQLALAHADYRDIGYAYHSLSIEVRTSPTVSSTHRALSGDNFVQPWQLPYSDNFLDLADDTLVWLCTLEASNHFEQTTLAERLLFANELEGIRDRLARMGELLLELAEAVEALMHVTAVASPADGPRRRFQEQWRRIHLRRWIRRLPEVREGVVTEDEAFAVAEQSLEGQSTATTQSCVVGGHSDGNPPR